MRRVPLGNTHYFKFTTRNFSTGAPYTLAGTPVISVYEENNLTQITAGVTLTADYDTVTGLNSVAVAATSGNGYEVGKSYAAVITTGTVNSVSVVGEVVDQFEIVPAENTAGYPLVDTSKLSGTTLTARDIGASVLLSSGTGTGQISLSSGTVTVGTNNDKTGYSLTQTFPTNFADLAITVTTGQVTVGTNNDKTGYSLTQTFPTNFADLSITATTGRVDVAAIGGTAQTANDNGADLALITGTDGVTLATSQPNYTPAVAGDAMTLTAAGVDLIWDEVISGHKTASTTGLALGLAGGSIVDATVSGTPTSTTFDFTGGNTNNGFYDDQVAYILSGTGALQNRPILSSTYTGGTTTITVDEPFITTPASGDRVVILLDHVHPKTQIRDTILADSTPFNGADIPAILTDTGTTIPDLIGTPSVDVSTDIASVKTDTGTTLPGLIGSPTVDLATDLANRTPTAAQLAYIVANAATGLPVTFSGTGTTTTGTLALVDGNTPSATNDQYKSRVLVFNAGTLNQAVTDITAYDGTTKVVTVTAVPVAITSAHTARLI